MPAKWKVVKVKYTKVPYLQLLELSILIKQSVMLPTLVEVTADGCLLCAIADINNITSADPHAIFRND